MSAKEKAVPRWPQETRFFGLRVSAIVEIILFFLILFLIALLNNVDFNFFKASPHPYWILVILISAQYGILEGLLAAAVSTIMLMLGPLPERSALEDKFEYFFILSKTPLQWFIAALILGELRMKHIRERDSLREIAKTAEEKEKKVAESYNALKKIKERLELRVVSETQTALMAIAAFKKLEESTKESVISGTCDLIKMLIAPEKFSIYLLEAGQLKQIFFEGWEPGDTFADSFGPDSSLYREIIDRKEVVSIYGIGAPALGKEGLLAGPIVSSDSEQAFGMLKIEQIPFLRLRTTAIETLQLIGELVGRAYSNALTKRGSR